MFPEQPICHEHTANEVIIYAFHFVYSAILHYLIAQHFNSLCKMEMIPEMITG